LCDSGFDFQGYRVYGWDRQRRRVSVFAEGDEVYMGRLPSRLVAVEGITEVIEVQRVGPMTEPGVLARGLRQESPFVNDIVWAYPRIRYLLEEFEQAQPWWEREHRVTKLGVEVGSRMGAYDSLLHEAMTPHAALQNAIAPALKPVAQGIVEGDNLKITRSLFVRRNLDRLYLGHSRGERGHCFFLSGLIFGMLKQARRIPRVWVTETACRELGDGYCYFRTGAAAH
jgi:hypothetical protein